MPKFTDDELKQWFNSPNCCQISKSDRYSTDHLVKIPYENDFDLLFYSRTWYGTNIKLDEKLESAGLYYRKDGCIYNPSYSLDCCLEDSELIAENSGIKAFAKKFTELVTAKVEEIIDNKRSNLTVKELIDSYFLNQLEYYSKYGAANAARKEFINGNAVSDIVYKCPFSTDSLSDKEYIQFILDKEPLVEKAAKAYIEEKQENILSQFYNNSLLRKELQSIYDNPEHSLHRIKAIIGAVKESGAKTVNVTINKDNKDFTFKYEADSLKYDPGNAYSLYNIKATDRREFENLFGRGSAFYPNEITQITYGRNVIYNSSEFDMTETEDAAMEQAM